MRKLIVLGVLVCIGFFCEAKEIKSQEIAINDTVSVTIIAIKNPVNSVTYKQMIYKPKDPKNDTMAEVVISIKNNGQDALIDLAQLRDIELVCADKNGELIVSRWEAFIDDKNKAKDTTKNSFKDFSPKEEYEVKPGSAFKKAVYFVHNKKFVPVAFTQNRKVVFGFFDADKNATVISRNLTRIEKFSECSDLVKNSSSEEIVKYMNDYGITFQDEDRKGFTLLYYAIGFHNNEFFDVAIQQKADTKHTISYLYGMMKYNPIQFAVMSGNSYAVKKLIEAGEDLFYKDSTNGIGDIGPRVIQDNNLAGAKILAEYGYDFSVLTIGGGWSKKETAIEYAESHKYIELLAFLKTVVK